MTTDNKTHLWKNILGGMVGALVVLTLVGFLGFGMLKDDQATAYSQEDLIEFESVITGIVDDTQNAVVSVSNFQRQQVNPYGSFFGSSQGIQSLEDLIGTEVLAGTGSGVIYKVEGDLAYVVTNNHVIEGNDSLSVTMADGTEVEAEVIGADALSDLAVLQISSESVTDVIEFADSDATQVGSLAIAIGSPLGSEFATSVTQGIVSGLNRTIPVDTDGDGTSDWEMTLMQTDAAINPGNSGGALVNSKGQLIGINSSKLASSQIEGMGFAIPSNDVQQIVAQLEANGEVVRPVLGTTTVNLNQLPIDVRVNELGLPEEQTDGAIIIEVQNGSSAFNAGLEELDVIVAVNDEAIRSGQELRQNLYKYQVGETISITIYRDGQEQTIDVTLQAASNQGF